MMVQPNLTPFPPGRYFANLFSSAEINDWAIAQFFHDAGRYFGGQTITVRVDPIMREGEQHGWQLTAWTMRQEELAADELRAALSNAIALIGHRMPMDTTALVAGEKLVAHDVWRAGITALGEAT